MIVTGVAGWRRSIGPRTRGSSGWCPRRSWRSCSGAAVAVEGQARQRAGPVHDHRLPARPGPASAARPGQRGGSGRSPGMQLDNAAWHPLARTSLGRVPIALPRSTSGYAISETRPSSRQCDRCFQPPSTEPPTPTSRWREPFGYREGTGAGQAVVVCVSTWDPSFSVPRKPARATGLDGLWQPNHDRKEGSGCALARCRKNSRAPSAVGALFSAWRPSFAVRSSN